ncbi:MAG: hypothetical protein C4555_06780 [Dehalococcoidia bacterium]|nr:MAG: hypothetical protein C4555_06780 [Dehalococcoidia bacterium]
MKASRNYRKEYKWPAEYHMITWLGTPVIAAHSWADLLAQDTGMKMHIGGTTMTVNRFRWLRSGLSQQTEGTPSETSQMVMADRRYAVRDGGPFPVRVLWIKSKGNATFFTRGDSKIKTPHGIKPGTRITDMNPYVAATRVVDGLLAWAQVKHEDIVWVPVYNSDDNIGAVVEGRADICFSMPSTTQAARAATNPFGLSCVELNAEADPEGARRYRQCDPLINFGIIPKEVLPAIGGKWGTQGLNLEFTSAREPAEQVYQIARWLDENHERYKDGNIANLFRTRQWLMKALEETFVPVHEGLKMYLRDLGLWTAKHEKRDRKNLEILNGYITEFQKIIWAADDKGLDLVPENEEWIHFWESHRDKTLPPIKLWANLEEE